MKLYHYSNKKINRYIKIGLFGNNTYTSNDIRACNVKRAFYYLDNKIEHRFKYCQYVYIVNVNKKLLYDLRQDKNGLINKCRYNGLDIININKLFKVIIKRGYIGVIYNTGNLNIVSIFKDLKYSRIIKKRGDKNG